MREWFVVDPKHAYNAIKEVEADVKCGDKLAFIDYVYRGRKKRSIVGASAFPYRSSAIANQNDRCRRRMNELKKYGPKYFDLYLAFQYRLEQNFIEEYMKQGDKFRNNDGTIATIDHVSGKKVFFTVSMYKGSDTISNFKKRFPVKV